MTVHSELEINEQINVVFKLENILIDPKFKYIRFCTSCNGVGGIGQLIQINVKGG